MFVCLSVHLSVNTFSFSECIFLLSLLRSSSSPLTKYLPPFPPPLRAKYVPPFPITPQTKYFLSRNIFLRFHSPWWGVEFDQVYLSFLSRSFGFESLTFASVKNGQQYVGTILVTQLLFLSLYVMWSSHCDDQYIIILKGSSTKKLSPLYDVFDQNIQIFSERIFWPILFINLTSYDDHGRDAPF